MCHRVYDVAPHSTAVLERRMDTRMAVDTQWVNVSCGVGAVRDFDQIGISVALPCSEASIRT